MSPAIPQVSACAYYGKPNLKFGDSHVIGIQEANQCAVSATFDADEKIKSEPMLLRKFAALGNQVQQSILEKHGFKVPDLIRAFKAGDLYELDTLGSAKGKSKETYWGLTPQGRKTVGISPLKSLWTDAKEGIKSFLRMD
ncbi:MAG TPA: hypothetical protein V6C52_12690 [Coleofasciculaceae cyanobacterium]|jgi:hypothetical protein